MIKSLPSTSVVADLADVRARIATLDARIAAIAANATGLEPEAVDRVSRRVEARLLRAQDHRRRLVASAQKDRGRLIPLIEEGQGADAVFQVGLDELRLLRAIGEIDLTEFTSRRAVLDAARDSTKAVARQAENIRAAIDAELALHPAEAIAA